MLLASIGGVRVNLLRSCTLSPTDWKSGATQTKPASAGFKTLNLALVRVGGLCLYSRDFNRQGLVQDLSLLTLPNLPNFPHLNFGLGISSLPNLAVFLGCDLH